MLLKCSLITLKGHVCINSLIVLMQTKSSLKKAEGRECGVCEVGSRERPGRRCVVALAALHGTVSAGPRGMEDVRPGRRGARQCRVV